VLTTRGGDFELNLGRDVSIGYLSHTASAVRLYLQQTFVFRVLTSEASVALSFIAKVFVSGIYERKSLHSPALAASAFSRSASYP
jgi:hypothetical protein